MQPTSASVERNYVLATFDKLGLLFFQEDVKEFKTMSSAFMANVGLNLGGGDETPTYVLSGDMQPLTTLPQGRQNVVVLKNHQRIYELACDQVDVLTSVALNIQILPRCMQIHGSPLKGVANHDGSLAFFCAAVDLARYLESVSQT